MKNDTFDQKLKNITNQVTYENFQDYLTSKKNIAEEDLILNIRQEEISFNKNFVNLSALEEKQIKTLATYVNIWLNKINKFASYIPDNNSLTRDFIGKAALGYLSTIIKNNFFIKKTIFGKIKNILHIQH